jgi:hypothetical protein
MKLQVATMEADALAIYSYIVAVRKHAEMSDEPPVQITLTVAITNNDVKDWCSLRPWSVSLTFSYSTSTIKYQQDCALESGKLVAQWGPASIHIRALAWPNLGCARPPW